MVELITDMGLDRHSLPDAVLRRVSPADRKAAGLPGPLAEVVKAAADKADMDDGSESSLHDAIIEECRRRGWIAFHSRMDRKTTRQKGECDFHCLLPNGFVIFVECKSRKGKLSIEQQAMAAWMKKLGHKMHIVRTLDEFQNICAMALSGAYAAPSKSCVESRLNDSECSV